MVRSLISISVVFTLLVCGAFIEQRSINKNFSDFKDILNELYVQVESYDCDKDDALAVQKWWLVKKKAMHSYIPHNDIKDVDLWLAECVSLIYTKDFDFALAKLEVLMEICENIPGAYSLKKENIF